MKRTRLSHLIYMVITISVLQAGVVSAQGNKVLTLDDYPQWRRIGSTAISPDGNWVTYAYRPNEGDDTLYVELLDGETSHIVPMGSGPVFSGDSRWVACTINPSNGGNTGPRRGSDSGGGAADRQVQLLDLETGSKYTTERASGFTFSEGSHFLAINKRQTEQNAEHGGSDLILRNLTSGLVQNMSYVSYCTSLG